MRYSTRWCATYEREGVAGVNHGAAHGVIPSAFHMDRYKADDQIICAFMAILPDAPFDLDDFLGISVTGVLVRL